MAAAAVWGEGFAAAEATRGEEGFTAARTVTGEREDEAVDLALS